MYRRCCYIHRMSLTACLAYRCWLVQHAAACMCGQEYDGASYFLYSCTISATALWSRFRLLRTSPTTLKRYYHLTKIHIATPSKVSSASKRQSAREKKQIDLTGNEGRIQNGLSLLLASSGTIQINPPPSCVMAVRPKAFLHITSSPSTPSGCVLNKTSSRQDFTQAC